MVVGFSLDISVCKKEDGENNGNDVPAGKNQSGTKVKSHQHRFQNPVLNTQREDTGARNILNRCPLIPSRKCNHRWDL